MPIQNLRSVSRHPITYVLILFSLLSGLGFWWFLEHFEKKEVEVFRGMSPEAARNRLLAAERYLELSGIEAESLAGLDLLADLPSTSDAIFIRRLPAGLARNSSDDLLDWVETGGHLLMVPNDTAGGRSSQETLGNRIGVRFVEDKSADSDCGCPPAGENEAEIAEGGGERLEGQEAPVPPAERAHRPFIPVMRVTIDGYAVELDSKATRYLEDLSDSADYRIPGTYVMEYTEEEDQAREDNFKKIEIEDAWLLQYAIGRGKITVFSDIGLFENSAIDSRDNAFLLSYLVRDAEKVWLLYSSNVDPLPVLAWKKFPLFWVSLLATMLLFVWMKQMRPGPLRHPAGGRTHNILTHIDAVGRFCWRMDQCAELLHRNRRSFVNRRQSRTQGNRADTGSMNIDSANLAGKTGLSIREISDAFHLHPQSEQDLIRSSRALQKCMKTLHPGGRKQPWQQ